ncbi:UDP-N-acetylbacillosamine N-acetyltransferase [Neolewinella maritima]|uniref:UDP-N-acetylbacillosamine N-acetyltransferase n=1 Tax=Neolewinella maritima TaxID=1383882 RepID=A0ABN8F006_9BACT|nr:acetyltransferase [Neolewinella maritima]CAH0998976.1 UDP-N-acetylbacillosamine N-acetyltransferase [Neolewinella maritima]
MNRSVLLIGYSGHAFVVADVLRSAGRPIVGYCDREQKIVNPFGLTFFGPEAGERAAYQLRAADFFVAIGSNTIRRRVSEQLLAMGYTAAPAAVHPSSQVSRIATVGPGTLVGPGAVVNALTEIGQGAIINSAAVVEHECRIGDFAHIAPGAVLTGNVTVGAGAFIGARAVVLPGIKVGKGAIIGAGAVVLRDVFPGQTMYGNPAKLKV